MAKQKNVTLQIGEVECFIMKFYKITQPFEKNGVPAQF